MTNEVPIDFRDQTDIRVRWCDVLIDGKIKSLPFRVKPDGSLGERLPLPWDDKPA
jgi:hypothetical protein